MRVTDTAGLVGEATLPVVVAPHRPLGDLRRVVDGNGHAVDGIDVSSDGRYVLHQDDDPERPDPGTGTPIAVLDRETGTSELVSVLPDGTVHRFAWGGALSADGRTAIFAIPMGEDGQVGSNQVYVRRLDAGETVIASLGTRGELADAGSVPEGVSADGRWVLFSSFATNLVSPPTSGRQLFLRDLETGTTTLVSVDADGEAIGTGHDAQLSADGSTAVFQGRDAVWAWDRGTGVATRLDIDPGGERGDKVAEFFDLTPDGRYVTFSSESTALAPGDANGRADVFRYDRQTGEVVLVSVAAAGDRPGSHGGGFSAVSDDGRLVAFWSLSDDLVEGDANGRADVFVRDLVAGTTRLVSVEARDGSPARLGALAEPMLTGDGLEVLFESDSPDLVPGDVNQNRDLFALRLLPRDPEDPQDPDDPEQPEDPQDPQDPEQPEDPQDPTDPVDPERPEDPRDPADPQAPEERPTTTTGGPSPTTAPPAEVEGEQLDRGPLPRTGGDTGATVRIGALLVAGGVLLLVDAARRRREARVR